MLCLLIYVYNQSVLLAMRGNYFHVLDDNGERERNPLSFKIFHIVYVIDDRTFPAFKHTFSRLIFMSKTQLPKTIFFFLSETIFEC